MNQSDEALNKLIKDIAKPIIEEKTKEYQNKDKQFDKDQEFIKVIQQVVKKPK